MNAIGPAMSPALTVAAPAVRAVYPSPVGDLHLTYRAGALARLDFDDHAPPGPATPPAGPDAPVHDAVRRWLDVYFAGRIPPPESFPRMAMAGTPFQIDVWLALRDVPWGATASYGDIARRIARPAAVRAVGAANGANPVSIIVPCHRVIGTNGSLTGYGGGLPRKTWLLNHERASTQPDLGL